jgi:hypothetical protein
MNTDNESRLTGLTELVGRQAYLIKHCWDDPAAREEYDEIEYEIRGEKPDIPALRNAVEHVAAYLEEEVEHMYLSDDPADRANHIGNAVLTLRRWLKYAA